MSASAPRRRPMLHGKAAERPSPACAVRLIDRRTGAPHRVNGAPLLIITRNPEHAAAELLAGRDPALWEARIETFTAEDRA